MKTFDLYKLRGTKCPQILDKNRNRIFQRYYALKIKYCNFVTIYRVFLIISNRSYCYLTDILF